MTPPIFIILSSSKKSQESEDPVKLSKNDFEWILRGAMMKELIIEGLKHRIFITVLFLTIHGFSQEISALYEKSNGGVVFVQTMQTEELYEEGLKTMSGLAGFGSGFVISKEGDILTAAHLIQTAEQIMVTFADGEQIPARVLYSFPLADVAMIRTVTPKSTPLTVLKMGDSDKVKTGDQVFIIGAPYGLRRSLSVGYVSGKYKRDPSFNGLVTNEYIQSDAAINIGSSGGPMFNMSGEVIGIASFILSRTEGFQGLGFATTSNIAKKLLLEEHSIWTGIESDLVFGALAQVLNLPQSGGVLVQRVAPRSLGDVMGLHGGQYRFSFEDQELILGGDIILTLEKIPLTNEENLIRSWYKLQSLKSGDSINITILRSGEVIEIQKMIP